MARAASLLLAVTCVLSLAAADTDTGFARLQHPSLFVDKVNYTLEVVDGDSVVKTYPIDLGRDPVKRKLHQDNATTPEGIYRITNLRPVSTFHKTYDLSYPNDVDRQRYRLLCPRGRPDIGGSWNSRM